MTTPAPAEAEPTFVLTGAQGVVVADGVHTTYPALQTARAALAAGSTPIMVGALPFDLSAPTALFRPQSVRFVDALPDWSATTMPAVRVADFLPAPQDHRARVAAAVRALNHPDTGLQKVVLARALHLTADAPIDARTVLRRLNSDDASANAYLADLSAAGGAYRGAALIGASPELLVARRGEVVTCQPFAGSAPRFADPEADRASGEALAASAKNRHEHAIVIDEVRKALDPFCADLQIAPAPHLSATAAVWHLSTQITGRLRETSTTALDLAVALHPTPAVGGVPTDAAAALIKQIEGDRGFYAGAVGWCDAAGDGRWVVSIRCAQLAADRRSATAHSGGGIVAESDPDDEVAETTTKFTTILSALGVAQ
ncbi:isochorismate synthase [Mycolicibacterium litorale]|uniref:isochorismate synthase n=1 Tax=Mycolicibacterium litorale TaxID=758802 RepID=UPI0010655209|nr:isochorismate synthase [Mycolicibacterium litorale]MCV7415973.1 isochorismate synthase [Mycolicibacterium litorale]